MKKAQKLLEKYRNGQCTPEELALFRQWFHFLGEDKPSTLSETDLLDAKLRFEGNMKHVLNKKHSLWLNMAAAAAILAVFGFSAYFLITNHTNYYETQLATHDNYIVPGGNKAILTLANGKKITLDDVTNGRLIEESGVKITKTANGQLEYEVMTISAQHNEHAPGQPDKSEMAYNIIETPRGGQYKIILPDSSSVWLNSASSLRYPTRFVGNERRVVLKGEAYFEIRRQAEDIQILAKGNGKVPTTNNPPVVGHGQQRATKFIVQTATQEVEVLGTHFNINAYEDEPVVRTTLLEGSVRVWQLATEGSDRSISHVMPNSLLIKPHQQSILSSSGISLVKADIEEAVAWKEGMFRFNDESLESIMRKISRWYDVEVKYADPEVKNLPFNGIITHFSKVSKVLDMLERTKQVHFKINGRTIIASK